MGNAEYPSVRRSQALENMTEQLQANLHGEDANDEDDGFGEENPAPDERLMRNSFDNGHQQIR